MADLKNKVIGGFQVLQEIQAGSGSQGMVYKALCVDAKDNLVPVGTIVALKVMAVQDEDRKQWRKLEKRTVDLARMNSPNVVKYYGCFSEAGLFNDIHVIVQEFLLGETLKERMLRFPLGLDVDEALRIADAALAGLTYTSKSGIIHRDIKPGNIFLCSDGAVKLIDFEIAKQSGGTTTSSAGNIRGSFDYMAPDFTDANFHGDVQSDIFSMGVVLHEMLTGKTPYQRLAGDDKQANFAFLSRWAHSLTDNYNPIRISSRINRLLAHTEEVMSKALAPRRDERYADFDAFREGLKAIRFRNLRNGQNVYQMLQFIGKGGFGEVFKARLRHTGQFVAVKHLLKATYAERFYREAKIMKKVHDPSFVQFVDFFTMDTSNGQEAFLVMDFLDGMPGSSLRDAIRNTGDSHLPWLDVFKAFERYAKGLKILHAAGIFHRDIKPSNLYFPAEHSELAAIMDLGIARDVNGTATHGQVPGTLDYMPPEVVIKDSRGDGGMDIYALGLCFYEALTSKMAFPKLPTGTTAYAEFFDRARLKTKPSFNDSVVQSDQELLSLLTDMTNPELELRINDAGLLLSRLRKLRESHFPETAGDFGDVDSFNNDAMVAAQSGFESETVAETVALDDVPQTVATQWGDVSLEALKQQRKVDKSYKRSVAKVVASFLVTALIGVGVFFSWESVLNRYAAAKLDDVIEAYRIGDLQVAQHKESVWRTQWAHSWFRVDNDSFSALVSKLESEKKKFKSGNAANVRTISNIDSERQKAIEIFNSCFTTEGNLDETNFYKLDGLTLPENITDEAEVRRYLELIGESVVSAIKAKLDVYPPSTRRNRLQTVKKILENSWAKKLLAASEINALRREIEMVSLWCVGMVTNKCETTIQLDGKTIPVGGAMVAVYKDGHSENGIITRQGSKPMSLPPKFDGAVFEVTDDLFELVHNQIVESYKVKVVANEPIDTRQSRLLELLEALECDIAAIPTLNEDEAIKNLKSEIKSRQQWVVGKIQNDCHDYIIEVGEYRIEPGKSQLFIFENGLLPKNWQCEVPGVGVKELRRDLDGHTIIINDDDFVVTKVRVSVPKLDEGVSCYFDGKIIHESLLLKPGTYSVVYQKNGYEDQVVQFEVVFGKPSVLPYPNEWKICTVKVNLNAKLPDGVSCIVDGRIFDSTVMLPLGNHICEFVRADYKTQTNHFVIATKEPVSLPSIVEWEPSLGLKNLNLAEKYIHQRNWLEAKQALTEAVVSMEENKNKKKKLIDTLENQNEVLGKVEDAIVYYDGGFYGDAIMFYYEAYKLGYSLTVEDKQRLKNAYQEKNRDLQNMIKWTKGQMDIKRTVDRTVDQLEAERKSLFDCYNEMK